jgi:hypothetical protein
MYRKLTLNVKTNTTSTHILNQLYPHNRHKYKASEI